jgi:chromate reductase
MRPLRFLALCGSLRAISYNAALLRACAALAPDGVVVEVFDGMGALPLFNPDRMDEPGPAVRHYWARLAAADGLLIASPEYAHGVSAVLKNALDWGVGVPYYVGMPVALLNASPRAHHGWDAAAETLTTMSARLVPDACAALPLLGSRLDAAGIAADPDMAEAIRHALSALAAAPRQPDY